MAVYQTQAQQDFFKGLLKDVYKANEAPVSLWYEFSDAGGNSGYSFGQPQWDVKTNFDEVKLLLNQIGLSVADIDKLQKKIDMVPGDLTRMNNLLALNQVKVNNLFNDKLNADVKFIEALVTKLGTGDAQDQATANIIAGNTNLQMLLVDYHNQFNLQGVVDGRAPGKALQFLQGGTVRLPGGKDGISIGQTFEIGDWFNFYARTEEAIKSDKIWQRQMGRIAAIEQIADKNGLLYGAVTTVIGANGPGVVYENASYWNFQDTSGNKMTVDKASGTMSFEVSSPAEGVVTRIEAGSQGATYSDFVNGTFLGATETVGLATGEVYTSYYNASNQLTGGQITYTAQPGDTVAGVAAKMGITPQKFLEFNPDLTAGSVISLGSSLNIPVGNTSISLPPPNNSLLTVATATSTTQWLGATNIDALGAGVAQGLVYTSPVGQAQIPLPMINNGGYQNTELAGIVSDGYRPGDWNLSPYPVGKDPLSQWYNKEIDFLDSLNPVLAGVGNTLTGDARSSIYIDPLVLDLNGDGVKLTDYSSDPVLFDIDNDGGDKEITGWVSPQDGLLVMDLNGNGTIDNIRETFSEYFNGTAGTGGNAGTQPYTDGFAALKSQDSNGDNVFTSSDTAWNNVKVWVDANHDAKTDLGELKTLAALGITQINLTAQSQSGLVRDGNEVLSSGTFIQSGLTKEALALNFLANPNGHSFVASGTGTTVSTQGGVSSYVASNAAGEVIDVTAKGVNNAYGAQGNDILTGNGGDNWLVGAGGADTFNAGAANESLFDADAWKNAA